MSIKFLVFFSLIFVISHNRCLCQNGVYNLGARSSALANASATISDEWALFNNVAGIGDLDHTKALASFNRDGFAPFSTMGAGFILSQKWGQAGISFFRFGDEIFNESKIGLGYGTKISFVSLGIQLNYVQLSFDEFGSKGALAVEIGGIAEVVPGLLIGIHAFNLNQARLFEDDLSGDDRIPTVLRLGLAYRAFEKVLIAIEVEKDVDLPARFRAGLEYQITDKFILRTGVSTDPFKNFFGFGFRPKRFSLDYALENDPNLGVSHELSISYRLSKI